jgi:hypothetical protein
MSRWILSTEREDWGRLFTAYQHSSYRLEAQQIYSNPIENVRVEQFMAGTAEPPTYEWRLSRVQERIAAGATKTTVRVVVQPATDYTRMEMYYYPILTAGGEDVRVIAVAEGEWPEGLIDYDYFVFDERAVWRMHYNDDYSFHGAELLEGPDVLADHLRWRDIALAQAVPLHEYRGLEMISV